MLRVGVLAILACTLAIAGGSAYGARPKQAAFKVTLSATLTKEWKFTRVDDEDDCTRTTRGSGRWEVKLTTQSAGRVRAIAAANGRVRFSGAVLKTLRGAAAQWGSTTTSATGPQPCERFSRTARCGQERRTFRGASASVGSPRKGIVQLGRLRGADAIRSFRSDCLEEPSDIRAIRTDLPLATGPLDAGDVFDRNVPRWFITGDTEQETALTGGVQGRVIERVRWRLNFTRLAR